MNEHYDPDKILGATTGGSLRRYQNMVVSYELKLINIQREAEAIYKEHEAMSNFLAGVDICGFFSKWFSKYWKEVIDKINDLLIEVEIPTMELNAITKLHTPITEHSPYDTKNLLVYYMSFCAIYKDLERIKHRIEYNNWSYLKSK